MDESVVPGGPLNLISTNYPDHGHRELFSYSRKNAHGSLRDVREGKMKKKM
jgi:hypothetical protein